MFDFVECEMPLPFDAEFRTDLAGCRFQTKDFECRLELIRIGADGSLSVDPKSNPFGRVQEIRPDYLGHVHFYGHTEAGEWVSFEAAVVDGKVRSIKRLEDDRW